MSKVSKWININGLTIALADGLIAVNLQLESVKKLLPLEFTWLLPGMSIVANLFLSMLQVVSQAKQHMENKCT